MTTRITGTVKQNVIEFLEAHREDIRYAKKGYIPRLIQQLKDEKQLDISPSQLKRMLDYFRITHDCPLEYVPNSHYKSLIKAPRNYRLAQTTDQAVND